MPYRQDALALVSVTSLPDAPWNLQQLSQSLLKPRFHLYLGRKSCPPGAPLDPQCIAAQGFKESFEQYVPKPILNNLPPWEKQARWLPPVAETRYYWEGDIADFAPETAIAKEHIQLLVRHDQPLSRLRWQFAPRQEYFYQCTGES